MWDLKPHTGATAEDINNMVHRGKELLPWFISLVFFYLFCFFCLFVWVFFSDRTPPKSKWISLPGLLRLQLQHLDLLLMPCRCRRMWKGWVWRTGGGGGWWRGGAPAKTRTQARKPALPNVTEMCYFNGCATVSMSQSPSLGGPGDRRVEHASRVRYPQYEAEPVQPQHTPLPRALTHARAHAPQARARRRRRTHFRIQMWNTKWLNSQTNNAQWKWFSV